MKKNERLQALKILTKVVQDKTPLSYLMQTSDLTPFTKEICFGVCRHYFRLQSLADLLLDKQPKAIEVWIAVLMGLYQLHFMQKPDYAVVKETVNLLDQIKKSWAKGLVNAVLRRFCREQNDLLTQLQANDAFVWGHPQWFVERLQKDWPQNWQDILTANDSHPPMSLRVNTTRETRESYLHQLEQAGIDAYPLHYAESGIGLKTPCDVHSLPGFDKGEVSVQDESAQLSVSLLLLQPGLKVLDACCAPGGKTCHILETQPELGVCVALDIDAKRLERVKENLSRLQLQATLLQADAVNPSSWWDGKLFDRILLDAPCSATGVIRRHPDIKLLRTPEEIEAVVKLQLNLLQSLWPLLSPEGLLVYATCSIMKEENEHQIAKFLASHQDCIVMKEDMPWGYNTGYGWQILPEENGGDGFFYSVLKKGNHAN
ncbi:16S rRNA (cytosine(967)-C(5))-methyltransferase RsmB [Legionella hackeliae]|uniref:16S rRNA (cytosine(967)-C(5))-methyltransferase n=1 Tax=Legionella hackeliae TaxID=449 RepID=A0A0A8UT02_LEGHA|nr:16S rRNA (cytosine(967)-C(5))-methyltransferase RsmB [Legionella hackeliae]KTD12465.1 Ribosomal RNA small subunit methyltransferase B [Legionella hackeliae]CEK11878.1 Ribosomal RNA small subunit methyltransferase B [Legionella hackeliae]STX48644.1 16S rRNA m5C967 methyltransferase, S-adenosyl-L -methionine-dependent [Legionella hackeliae]